MLKKRYVSAKVQIGKGMGVKPNRRALDKIFVNVVVIPREELASMNEQTFFGSQSDVQKLSHVFSRVADKVQHVQLANMFDFDGEELDEDESVRVLAIACAGAGKTTIFLLKGPMDWARGLIWHEFDIVGALALREPSVRHASDIVELLRMRQLGIVDPKQQNEIASYIHANPRRLCLVFDGLDETVLDDCSDFVRGIICGKELKGVRLILTSRHSKEVIKLALSCPFDRRVEVLGFTKDNVHEYVNNVLPCEAASKLLERVNSDPSLAAIMQTPFFTESTCDVFRICGSVPSSLFGIFTSLILSIVRQNTERAYPDWPCVPRILKERILELGHFAFLMLVEKKVVFSDRDLDEQQVSKESLSLGLLVACESLSHPCVGQWQFSHLSVQECLASQYIAATVPDASDITFLVRQVGALTGHLSTFWCLLASQLVADAKEALIAAILTQPVSDEEDIRKLKACESVTCFLRSSKDDLLLVTEVLCEHLDDSAVQSLASCLLTDLLADGLSVSQAIEEVLPHSFASSLQDYVRALLQLWRRKVPRASIRILSTALKPINPYASTRLLEYFHSRPSTSLDSDQLALHSQEENSVMTTSLSDSVSAVHEILTPVRRQLLLLACRVYAQPGTDTGDVANATHSPSPALEAAFLHYGCDFSQVCLSSADCYLLSSVISDHHKSIGTISLRACRLDDQAFELLAPAFVQCRGLSEVHLSYNALTNNLVPLICNVIRANRSTLRTLNIDELQLSSSGYAQLVPTIVSCHRISRLAIGHFQCQEITTNILICLVILAYCKLLCAPRLDFHVGDEGLSMLYPRLVSRARFSLQFQFAGLSSVGASVIRRVITVNHGHLAVLVLTRLSDMPLFTLAPSIVLCKALHVLTVDDGTLTSESLPVLASILLSCPLLRSLGVTDSTVFCLENDDGEGSMQFVRAVRRSEKLRTLIMPRREFVNDRLAGLLASVAAEVERDLRIVYDS